MHYRNAVVPLTLHPLKHTCPKSQNLKVVTNATLLQAITSLTVRFYTQDEKLEEMAI